MVQLYDRAPINGPARITRQGFLVADAIVAKANNIQDYQACELGLTDRAPTDIIRVFRPEAEVFHKDSLRTLSRLPITLDHPPEMVDAGNWSRYAKGETGEEVLRDGELLHVPVRVTDADAVDSVQRDRQEFSLGYTANIALDAGEFEGRAYDAVATSLRYNHLAACRAARGGPELRIVDERPAATGVETVKKIIVDGLPVNVADADAAETVITRLVAQRDAHDTDRAAAETKAAEAATTIAARDAEIVGLKDQLAKAQLTPQQMRDAAAKFGRTVDTAKKLGATVTDDMDELAVVRAALAVKMGDKAADYNDDQARVAFDVFAGQVGDAGAPPAPGSDPLANVIGDASNVTDATKAFAEARAARFNRYSNAHRGAAATA
jgi:hypothetical protein